MLAKADERQAFERRRKTLGWVYLCSRGTSAFPLIHRSALLLQALARVLRILIQIYCFKDFRRRARTVGNYALLGGRVHLSAWR